MQYCNLPELKFWHMSTLHLAVAIVKGMQTPAPPHNPIRRWPSRNSFRKLKENESVHGDDFYPPRGWVSLVSVSEDRPHAPTMKRNTCALLIFMAFPTIVKTAFPVLDSSTLVNSNAHARFQVEPTKQRNLTNITIYRLTPINYTVSHMQFPDFCRFIWLEYHWLRHRRSQRIPLCSLVLVRSNVAVIQS